jgi:hypothetical protein
MRRVGYVACMRREKVHSGFGGETWRERDLLYDQGIDGRIKLRWNFRWDKGAWTEFNWLRIWIGGRHL